ncbi:MAG: class I SAM-dependent methyltransferase [Actinomycetota bacterium]|nr:class I SAM-dependent methyltransferase [Actinomycetota bacterium]MDQ3426043.1 class I SAM-dependent methyltransferase [Actinomycetota bacterium]
MSGYDGFAPIYDRWAAHMTDDVGFYVDLARQADGPVVELAVGTGRVAIPITERTGQKVIGIDSSPAMLAVARERAATAGLELDLREGDMRDFSLDEPAALVICPFRSLLHLSTWADRRRVFERVAAALGPGGRFAWNAFVYDFMFAARHHGILQNDPVPHVIEHIPSDNRIDITVKDGPRISLWWISRGEWEALLDVSGLETDALYGWFDRRPFDEDSREFVWVARKPAS